MKNRIRDTIKKNPRRDFPLQLRVLVILLLLLLYDKLSALIVPYFAQNLWYFDSTYETSGSAVEFP